MTVIYFEDDADPSVISGKTISVIGYGKLGKPVAQRLLQSGHHLIVSGPDDQQVDAHSDGFTVATVANATREANILLLLLPDELMTDIYMQHVSPNLRRGATLILSSAYNIAFGFIEPPPFVDVGMISPRTVDHIARDATSLGDRFLSFVGVWQDASRNTLETILAVARAIGTLESGAIEINIVQEAEISLFIHQAVLPAFHHIMVTASRLLMEQGYPPEVVVSDLYLSGKFSDYMAQVAQHGLLHMLRSSSLTEQYSTLSRIDRFSELKLERLMEITLEEIRKGDFAQEWTHESDDGYPRLRRLLRQHESLDLWDMEQQTIEMLNDNEYL